MWWFYRAGVFEIVEEYSKKAQIGRPEDPEHPGRPDTSQIKMDKKGGRRRMIKKDKRTRGGNKNTLVEPTETFTSTE